MDTQNNRMKGNLSPKIKSLNKDGLKLLSFNVENLEPKLDEPHFIDLISSHDISFLCETWRRDDSKICLPGFWDFSQVRVKRKKAGRYSGGITIFVKENLRPGLKILNSKSEGFIWVKLERKFFNTPKDIFICATYIPPKYSIMHNSSLDIDYFTVLSNDLMKYIDQGNVLLLGDFNSRLGKGDQFSHLNHQFLDDMLPPGISVDSYRNSCDSIKIILEKK